ncbi:hypothetical protein ACH5RR_041330 [Cinchona calisaya]|uniref:Uncharacterized protein n=1 Tax=Cinchona calisaya TaxID=153742 RepID=A0ABD2XU26_9GENT
MSQRKRSTIKEIALAKYEGKVVDKNTKVKSPNSGKDVVTRQTVRDSNNNVKEVMVVEMGKGNEEEAKSLAMDTEMNEGDDDSTAHVPHAANSNSDIDDIGFGGEKQAKNQIVDDP